MNTTPSKDKGASNDLEAMLGEFTSAQQNKGRETQNSNKETLNNANRKGRMWLENSPVCTKIIDSDFNLQFMSSAGISALKIDKVEDYYGHPYPFSFFPQASIDNMKRCLTKVKESGETIVNEAPICDVFGNEVWYQAIISRVDHDDGTMDYIMVVSSEITQRKKAEEKLKLKNAEIIKQNEKYELLNSELKKLNIDLGKSKEKAEESEKLKSAFLANLSHEIRTPLNAILGFSRLLIEEQAVEEEEKLKFLNHIASGGNRLLRIITDTVDLSKIDVKQLSIENTNFNLNALMDSLQTQFSIQFDNEDVELLATKEFTDETSNISTDETRLAQVLSNMIENAGKFTKKGKIEFGYQRESEMLKFYVRDSGIGIAEKDLEVVFDRFRQVENDMSELNMGTGLGLSISKELIKLMNGEIWVESELNKGSTFYFTIPYSPSNAAKKKTLQKIQENVDLNY